MNDTNKADIDAARKQYEATTSKLNLNFLEYSGLGKSSFKSLKLSPDSMMQLSFQVCCKRGIDRSRTLFILYYLYPCCSGESFVTFLNSYVGFRSCPSLISSCTSQAACYVGFGVTVCGSNSSDLQGIVVSGCRRSFQINSLDCLKKF